MCGLCVCVWVVCLWVGQVRSSGARKQLTLQLLLVLASAPSFCPPMFASPTPFCACFSA